MELSARSIFPTPGGDPISPEVETFLFRLYASTRAEEVDRFGWPPAQRDAFLWVQHAAQRRSYELSHPDSEHRLILVDGEPVGRIWAARTGDEVRLVDVALLPEHRGQGIGAKLIHALLTEARAAGLPVRLHVEPSNPARRLYVRLGFIKSGDDGFRDAMVWSPSHSSHRQPQANVIIVSLD